MLSRGNGCSTIHSIENIFGFNFNPRPTLGSPIDYLVIVFGEIRLIARSVMAVIVRLGLTPKLAGMTEPSHTYNPG